MTKPNDGGPAFSGLTGQSSGGPKARSCCCIGPQKGDPVCPCQMPAYTQRQAERAAREREQKSITDALLAAREGGK